MKLLSHNHLLCLNKGCKSNEALFIDPQKVIQIESEPKLSFMIHILGMIDYAVLREAAKQIGIKDLPPSLPEKTVMEQESFLRSMQKVLLDSNVIEGRLKCSKCSTWYAISNGVVDMMHPQKCKEDEKADNDGNVEKLDVEMEEESERKGDANTDDEDSDLEQNDQNKIEATQDPKGNELNDDVNADMVDID